MSKKKKADTCGCCGKELKPGQGVTIGEYRYCSQEEKAEYDSAFDPYGRGPGMIWNNGKA